MSHSKSFAVALFATLITSCAIHESYDATAEKMVGREMPSNSYGFSKLWKPDGKDSSHVLTEEEGAIGGEALSGCIDQLTVKYEPPPGEILRAIQILECMKDKGWQLLAEEFISTH